ncbi:MAG: SLC13 family permease [Alphaproteobacteria bacterium]|nr:MAG: SLC13 family permease [Alphaproteobacteria bacterium]
MWFVFAVIAAAIVAYSIEDFPIEITSLVTLGALLIFFNLFPLKGPDGDLLLTTRMLVAGFAEPALIAIIALLVVGQGLVQTGALDGVANKLVELGTGRGALVIIGSLLFVALISGFLNNTPVVVIFIPIMSALAEKLDKSASSVMMPLSFAAILGGMTTLIGSSTNLLVSGSMASLGLEQLDFFSFTLPGSVLAGVGLVYVVFIAPRLLPERSAKSGDHVNEDGRQFIAEVKVLPGSLLAGEQSVAGMFLQLPGMTVRLIQRGDKAILPPFDETTLQAGDTVIVAATRKALTELFSHNPDLVEDTALPMADEDVTKPKLGSRIVAEVVIAPASRMDGRTLALSGFHSQTNCIVLGIQRRSRMIRTSMNDIRLEAGDVILVLGRRDDVTSLRNNPDVLLMEWSTREMPKRAFATRALLIFGGVVLAAATEVLPIEVAALVGAAMMVVGRCLNVRQAARAVDRRVMLLVATALALGVSMQATGGASFLAHGLVTALDGMDPAVTLSAFFFLIVVMTNVLSNNATAVLFTPIAVNMAQEMGVDVMPFILAVIFGANCSFATPISYQTNLLVMGPGHYSFSDFVRAGTPLIVLLWLTFSFYIPWLYGWF